MTAATGTLVERYVLAPDAIETLSLSRVRAAVGDLGLSTSDTAIVERMVYAAGDVALAALIRVHPQAVAAGCRALRAGCAVVADVNMVTVALNRAGLTGFGCALECAIADSDVAAQARAQGLPRAVLAMRKLAPQLQDGIAVIGNAPTALLALLDLVDQGDVRPALIIGTPVGFVAAAESKDELMARDIPYVSIAGTRGGSAVAAAAMNALLRLAAEA